jgi:hypothetical protein
MTQNKIYKNLSSFIPVKLWKYNELFRFQFPSIELTTPQEWIFDNSFFQEFEHWKMNGEMMYALNPFYTPPIPRGCRVFRFIQYKKPPFNTLFVFLGSLTDTEISDENSFIDTCLCFTYSIPSSIPILTILDWNEYNQLFTRCYREPDIENVDLYNNRDMGFVIYFLKSNESQFWKGTSEFLCIPSRDKNDFYTLEECQKEIYPKIKNKIVWVENGSEPLYQFMKWYNDNKNSQKNISFDSTSYLIVLLVLLFIYIFLLVWIVYKFQRV